MDVKNVFLPPGDAAGRRPWAVHVLALTAVFAAELALFSAATSRHYAWAFPRWFDQLQYLDEAYDAYDFMQAHGFLGGVRHALAHVSAQGALHGFLALLVFSVLGPSRLAALKLNLLAFLALQAVTFMAVRRLSGAYALAWAAVGLLAALGGPWSGDAGSAIDFRLDWMAASAYGVALALAVSGNGFRSTRWAVLFGAAVGIVLLTRFLTAVYFAVIFMALLSWLLSRPDRWPRVGRLVLSACCAAGVSGWAFWHGRRQIYDYYWIGHFASSEGKLRDAHLTAMESVRWICSEAVINQVGWPALGLGLGAAVALFLMREGPAPARTAPGRGGRPLPGAGPIVLVFFAAPALVLAVHPSKAEQPVSIIIPGVLWMIFILWMRMASGARRPAVAAVCAGVLLGGAFVFARGQLRSAWTPEMERESRLVNALADYVYFRSEENGMAQPRVAVTWVSGSLNADIMRILGRERHRKAMAFSATLPTGILSTTPDVVTKGLEESDFVFLVTRAVPAWPFDRQMESMKADLRTWCDGHLSKTGAFETAELSALVYERTALAGPPGALRASLPAMAGEALRGPADAPSVPPAPPLFLGPMTLLWTTKAELRYAPRTAYSPVTLRPVALPEGFAFDSKRAEIRGQFPHAGHFTARIAAKNPRGLSSSAVSFDVVDDLWGGDVRAPASARVGLPFEIAFRAFDPGRDLDFIDISDLTDAKVITRLVAGENQQQFWQATHRLTLTTPGRHMVVLRIVRYDPAAREPYGFVDRSFSVDVAP